MKKQIPTSYPTMINPTPRAVVELENAVLGAILLEKEAFQRASVLLNDTDFYNEKNGLVFNAVKSLYDQNKPIDMLTVIEELKRKHQLTQIGGPVFITELSDKVASTAHLEYHALLVKQKAIERQVLIEIQNAQQQIHNNEDIADVLHTLDNKMQSLMESFIGKSKGGHISLALKQAMVSMKARIEKARKNELSGINTGFSDLNAKTNGWQNADLVIVAGRPAMGKTALALYHAKVAAAQGIPVVIFSLEMPEVSLANRLILSECNVSAEQFRTGYLDNFSIIAAEKAAFELRKLSIYVDDNPSVSMDYIRAKSRILNKQGKCGMIIADYLQLATGNKDKYSNREQEVAQMSRMAKIIAKELNIPFLLLSQLNRGIETRTVKRPMLSDLRESGAIEQDADLVVFIHRPEYYGTKIYDKNDNEETNYGELIVAKHRNGATGIVKFKHNGTLTKFYDYNNQETPF